MDTWTLVKIICQVCYRRQHNTTNQTQKRIHRMQNSNKDEAERLIGIAEKLLQANDLNGAKDFAILAQEAEPLLESSDQILAIADVLLASNTTIPNQQQPWYDILQVNIDRDSQDIHAIRTQYRRLALLLHPDKNPFPNANHAFTLVSDAWAVLSDPVQKQAYDRTLLAGRSVPGPVHQVKLPVRRGVEPALAPVDRGSVNFWTACPYCYVMYEYPRVYEGCCLRCPSCERSFHGVKVPLMPQLVPGQEAYYCSWGFFPMGFVFQSLDSGEKGAPSAADDSDWEPQQMMPQPVAVGVSNGVASSSRKRGRPRKVV